MSELINESKEKSHDFKKEYLFEMLKHIKKRPGMYLGTASIIRLKCLLLGYMWARDDLGLPKTEQEKQFDGFQEWIAERYKTESTPGWAGIILSNSSDESEDLYKFFELLEEFLNGGKA